MKVQSRQSFNQDRKLAYRRLASEDDVLKEQRNAALGVALGEGAINLSAKMKTVTRYKPETYINKAGKEKTRRVAERVQVIPDRVVPNMPTTSTQAATANSKAAKRARRKAKAARLVADHKHPMGRCGNIGCRRCNPEQNRHPVYS